MKLAFCLFKYFPYGGLQRDFLRIAQQCLAKGHEVHVYTTRWDGERIANLPIHFIQARGFQNHTRNRDFANQVKKALDAKQYDLVIGFNKMPHLDVYYAADICLRTRLSDHPKWYYRFLPRYRQLLDFEHAVFAQNSSTEILSISMRQQTEFIRCYNTEAHRFHLLPPGIAKDRIAPDNAAALRATVREQFSIGPHQFLLLMVGSGFKAKGLDRAIKALAALPLPLRQYCELFVVGQDNKTSFVQLAKQLNIVEKVRFLGGRPDVATIFLAADLMVHPAYHENTGTVLLEAVASGLPVLTVDACGYAHYIQTAQAGIVLSAPFEQEALNQTLQQMLLALPTSSWKKNALSFAKSHDIYSMPERAAALIEGFGLKKQALSKISLTNAFTFPQFMKLEGQCYRKQKGRETHRVILNNKAYFIKKHLGTGWKEIFKNILQGRWPVLSARNEKQALERLQQLSIKAPLIASYGESGWHPAYKQSYILMEEVAPAISLEDFSQHWSTQPPPFSLKTKLIANVARIARTLHLNGINHRDFYICHFLLPQSDANLDASQLYLIDLHRAQIRSALPLRWQIKDLAALYFSSLGRGLTARDFYRFMKIYTDKPLKKTMQQDKLLWKKIRMRGEALYRDHQ